VIFPDTNAYTATVGAGESVDTGSATLGGDALLAPNPTLRVAAGGTLSVSGSLTLALGTLDLSGALMGTLTAPSYPQPSGTLVDGIANAIGTLLADGGTVIGGISLTHAEMFVTGDNLAVRTQSGGAGQIAVTRGDLTFIGAQTLDDVAVTLAGGTLRIGLPGGTGPQWLTLGPQTQLVLGTGAISGGDLSTKVRSLVTSSLAAWKP
jgi:hypothetical protein